LLLAIVPNDPTILSNHHMHSNDTSMPRQRIRAARTASSAFRLSPIAAVLASAFLAGSPAHAQQDKDRIISDLQAEISRLKEALSHQQPADASAAPAADAAVTGTAGAATAATAPAPSTADEPVALDAVVVRSRNRLERLQDVPLSVSVVSGRELDRLQANDIDSITKRLGNIFWNQGNQRTSSLAIRGIGKQSQTEAQDPSVGVIVDGVSLGYNALTSSYYFTDIDSVEVARGPQGTLLGKNSSIGAISFTTRRPSFTPSADYSLLYGQRGRVTGTFAGGGPIINDLLAWRGTFVVDKGKGDMLNRSEFNRDQTWQETNRVAGRAQFLLTPSADFNARVSLEIQPRSDETTNGRTIRTPTPTVYSDGSVNPLTTDAATRLGRRWFTQDPNGFSYTRDYLYGGPDGKSIYTDATKGLVTGSRGASAELNWNLGNHTLTSITAWRDYHFNAQNDEGTPFDVSRNGGGFWNDYKQTSQELRLSSKTGGFVDYQAGLHFIDVRNSVEYRQDFGNDAGAWFANNAQYNRLDADGAGRYLLQNSLDGLSIAWNRPGLQKIHNKSGALFGQANWNFTDALKVTTGLRFTREDRTNVGSSYIKANGNGFELNPVAVRDVQLGGFNSNAAGLLAGANSAAQLQLADRLAAKYFGTAATGTPGAAYNSLTGAQKQQVADAKAIRLANLGPLFGPTKAQPFKDTQPAFVLSPSYKFNEDLTTYVSWQYGEKAGIAQLTNGVSALVKGEKTNSFELGLKSALLDKTLVFNANLYLTRIKDFQQSIRALDTYTTQLNNNGQNYYVTATGNVPKVEAKGLELDGAYNGIPNTTIRFSGAYNNARYKKFLNAAQPSENGYASASPYTDLSGRTLPGASKYTFNIGVDYRKPIFGDKVFLASINTALNSRYNSDDSLSDYAWIPGKGITDLSVGLGRLDGRFTVSFLVKNVFDNKTPLSQTWNSYTPAIPRWAGILLTGKL
jgi:iron complex outermembrane receptor protein